MRRIFWVLGGGVVAISAWLSLLVSDLNASQRKVVETLPLYLVVALGCYSLGAVGYGVMIFPTCEKEAALLQKDVVEAKRYLSAHGIEVHPKGKPASVTK
eukprot:TRINITY_DN10093_c0_g1_i1.p1 TRINITY_DN10093_c0_g1~~TRINITY_DN10093_c0_g1_i1.p1  ORF type:complete len:100 (+),score=18.07 TRINITY_DN10093_c0_g1_i1:322-621(+)